MKAKKQIPVKNIVLGALRRSFSRCWIAREARTKSIHPKKKGPRGGKRYVCAKCKKDFGIREIQVDHKKPLIPLSKTSKDLDYNTIVERLFCKLSNLQILCTSCHKKKSKEENAKRRKYKKR